MTDRLKSREVCKRNIFRVNFCTQQLTTAKGGRREVQESLQSWKEIVGTSDAIYYN